MLRVIGRASSRMFGGLDLSRSQRWVDATIDFAIDGFLGSQKIKRFPSFAKPLVAPFISELRRMSGHYRTAREVVVPILQRRDDSEVKECDFLQWMKDDACGEEQDEDFIAEILLKMSFAAIHTSAATPMQLIYDLCANPEYIGPLRTEIEQVIPDHQAKLEKLSLSKLYKLDSIMKESMRFNPLLLSQYLTMHSSREQLLTPLSHFRKNHRERHVPVRWLLHTCRNAYWVSIPSSLDGSSTYRKS